MRIDVDLPHIPTIVPLQVRIDAVIARETKLLARNLGYTTSDLIASLCLGAIKSYRDQGKLTQSSFEFRKNNRE